MFAFGAIMFFFGKRHKVPAAANVPDADPGSAARPRH
jgi:hypothetical protein